ncbi:MBL fold metallo-hydrolase [Brevibacterium litoralis]|uniref:MBL fold metallo-hydrolase n=1 Tax=Brevibacterium litoralis TaxID=3138935 RepID=UPI0032EE438A
MKTLELADVVIRAISVSDMENNVYLLTARGTGEQLIIDAAADAPAIRDLVGVGVGDGPLEAPAVAAVLTTHQHWDHVRALGEIAQEYGARTVAGADDAEAIADQEGGTAITETVAHGDTLTHAGITLECIGLRGHTPGSIAYLLRDSGGEEILFSGDSLFPGGPGKTWNPEDFVSLMDDLESRVFPVLDDATRVFPGHGAPTTIGTERPHLSEWRARGW